MAGGMETLRAAAHQAAVPLRFGAVGACGVLVNTLVLWALAQHVRLPVWLAGALATEAAVMSNFVLNDRWTFRGRGAGRVIERFVRFNGLALGGMMITTALLTLLTAAGGLNIFVANGAAVAAGAGWNYVMSSRWAWKGDG